MKAYLLLIVALVSTWTSVPALFAEEKQVLKKNETEGVHPMQTHGTVVVGVAVAEGIVLVGDSRVTLQSKE